MTDRTATVATASGLAVGLAGMGLVGVGLWARREVGHALARERIVSTPDGDRPATPVTNAPAARAMAEVIRRHTLEAAGGRTYAETDTFLAGDGATTSDAAEALQDERTGQPIENPDHALWIQSTALQTALMQAYLSSRVADLTLGLGAALVTAGTGIAAVGLGRR